MTRFLCAAALLFVACKAHHPALKPMATSVRSKTLSFPSGLRVVAEQQLGLKQVAVSILIGAGAAADEVGHEGTAHLLGHVAFRTTPFTRLTLREELDYAGIQAEAGDANLFITTFDAVFPSDRLATVLPVFASAVVRPLAGIEPPAIDLERSVVRNEMGDPNSRVGLNTQNVLFAAATGDTSPGARPIGGTQTTLARLTFADLDAFAQTNYLPNKTTVVLVGDFEIEQLDALMRKAFPPHWLDTQKVVAPLNATQALPAAAAVPLKPSKPLEIEVDTTNTSLLFTWAVPGTTAPGGRAMWGLYATHRKAKQPLRQVGIKAIYRELIEAPVQSLFVMEVVLEPGTDVDATRKWVLENCEFKSLHSLDARNLHTLREFEAEQDLVEHARGRALRIFSSGSTSPQRSSLTEDEIKEVEQVATTLTWERAREVLVIPRLPIAPLGKLPAPLNAAQPRTLVVTPEMLGKVVTSIPVPEVREFTLPNGLRVVISKRGPVPVVSVVLSMPFAARHTTRLASQLMSHTIDWNPTRSREFNRLAEPSVFIDGDVTSVQMTNFAWELPVMLDVLGHNLSPTISWEQVRGLDFYTLAKERQRLDADPLDAAPRTEGERESEAALELRRAVLPAGSRLLSLTTEEMKFAERSQFVNVVDDAWKPKGAVLFIDGVLDVGSTELQVRELFSDWSNDGPPAPMRSLGAPPARPKEPFVIPRAKAGQTRVRMMCRVPAATTFELRGGNELLARALRNGFEDELKERRGAASSVWTDTTTYANEENLLRLEAVLDASDGQAALKQFFARLDSLEGAVWEPATVDFARWKVAHSFDVLQSRSVSARLASEMAQGATLEQATGVRRSIVNTPLKFVDQAWEACFDSLAIQLIGDPATLEPVLAARRK